MATALAQIEDLSPAVQEIRARMDKLNVGQAFIAEWNNFSQGEMSKILAGVRIPDAARVAQIERTLNDLESVKRVMYPMQIVWDVESVRVFVNEFVRKPEARKQLEESLERLRGGFDALGKGIEHGK
jgi:hypothetical protein